MSKIEEARDIINEIDDEIVKLYDRRMACAKLIGQEKAKGNNIVVDGNREKNIINRVTKSVNPEIMVYTKQLFNALFDTSKAYQTQFMHLSSNVSELIKKVLLEGRENFPSSANVACQGVEGAFSSIAAERLFALSDITYFRNFEGVFNAIEKGLCEFGILPIENSTVGSVNSVYDLMREHKFYIVKSIKLPVQHSLLAKKGVRFSDIREIVSHEHAINQCSELIKKIKNVKVTVCENTAVAAQLVAQSDRKDIAAISSKECASIYGLSIIESNVQTNTNNYTRFICISKTLKLYPFANKISIMVNLPHSPGSLNKMLSKFSTLGLNLTKLESRPLPNSDFEFAFYFDFEGDIAKPDVLNLIAELDNDSERFDFLGSYQEVM
ncbi:MAG: bifunctional chorismate mutase/prephenate dehydratase [Clostridia bacterium]|nr:bifunctional chorismate mutase/prephenate dehydratase [Clostridia bacterium]